MPFVCIGPVCIPWTALAPILFYLCRPLWVRLPPHVQSAIRSSWASFNGLVQAQVWDRLGWKARPAPKKGPAEELAPVGGAGASSSASLRSSMGSAVALRSSAEWEAAMSLSREGVQVVVDFTATWCGPCQRIAPFFAELAADHPSALFVKVDVDELEDVAAGAEVMAMPTFQRYEGGSRAETLTGANKDGLAALAARAAAK